MATHICDSVKRRLTEQGVEGLQGEFGIGLLSFWTVGERMTLACGGTDGRMYEMKMVKGDPGYAISKRRSLFSHPGTELTVRPLLSGLRQLSGERIQAYLASELRDRIRQSGVQVRVRDRQARKELEVKPREFTGRHLRHLDIVETSYGRITLEIYLGVQDPENTVALYRRGTRVIPSLTRLDAFDREPWTSGLIQGAVDVPFLQLTPGTRDGVVHDDAYKRFCEVMASVSQELQTIIDHEREAEEEDASRRILRSVQRALREALLALPQEDYSWFDVLKDTRRRGNGRGNGALFDQGSGDEEAPGSGESAAMAIGSTNAGAEPAPEFHEYPGPLHSVIVSPSTAIVKVGERRSLRVIARDRAKRTVDIGLSFHWEMPEGEGALSDPEAEIVEFIAPEEPGLSIVRVTVDQGEVTCSAEATITVTDSLVERPEHSGSEPARGIPGYTFVRATGELWRSRYDERRNVVVINNGHSDYLFASRKRTGKLKYVIRLFAKELVLLSFPGFEAEQLLERMVELSTYAEEHLR